MRPPAALVLLSGLLAPGCAPKPTPPAVVTVATAAGKEEDDHHGHAHDRATMMAADVGKYHAWLTAHISGKEGNELDVLFETQDEKDPKPLPLPLATFTGTAKRVGEDKEYELTFEPAPAEERKGDPPGQCSHFTAKAPWLKPDDVLTVAVTVEIDGRKRTARWRDFAVAKYTHHAE